MKQTIYSDVHGFQRLPTGKGQNLNEIYGIISFCKLKTLRGLNESNTHMKYIDERETIKTYIKCLRVSAGMKLEWNWRWRMDSCKWEKCTEGGSALFEQSDVSLVQACAP